MEKVKRRGKKQSKGAGVERGDGGWGGKKSGGKDKEFNKRKGFEGEAEEKWLTRR